MPPERQNGADTRVGWDPHGPDQVLQQATVNLFADMDVQPTTLQSDLVPAIASTDTAAPVSSLDPPGDVGRGPVTLTGTATDSGGGVVAAVEVSTDGGATWHPAEGRETWSYTWTPSTAGAIDILTRAVDDSGNLETPGVAIRTGGND